MPYALAPYCANAMPVNQAKAGGADGASSGRTLQAGERTRTADPFITSEVLYQLSYAGAAGKFRRLAPSARR